MISFESFQDLEKPFVFLISVTMYLNLCNIFHTLITVDILHHTKKNDRYLFISYNCFKHFHKSKILFKSLDVD